MASAAGHTGDIHVPVSISARTTGAPIKRRRRQQWHKCMPINGIYEHCQREACNADAHCAQLGVVQVQGGCPAQNELFGELMRCCTFDQRRLHFAKNHSSPQIEAGEFLGCCTHLSFLFQFQRSMNTSSAGRGAAAASSSLSAQEGCTHCGDLHHGPYSGCQRLSNRVGVWNPCCKCFYSALPDRLLVSSFTAYTECFSQLATLFRSMKSFRFSEL